MPSSRIAASMLITSWFAPPWLGPRSALIPAAMEENRFTIEDPTRRTELVEQFCSWSACRISSMSITRSTTGSTMYSSHGVPNTM
jgi:hypothetical protein